MKLLFLCNLRPDKDGAFERVLAEVGREHGRHGDQFVLVLAGEPIPEVAQRFREAGIVWRIIAGWGEAGSKVRPWRFVFPALKILWQTKPDVAVVHFGNELPSLVLSLLAIVVGLGKVRWVWQQDQQIAPPGRVTRRLSKIRLLALRFTRFIVVYEGGRNSMMARGIPASRITVVHNGVVDPGPEWHRDTVRQSLGIGEREVLLMGVGSLIPRKRQAFLLDVFAEVVKGTGRKSEARVVAGACPAPGGIPTGAGEKSAAGDSRYYNGEERSTCSSRCLSRSWRDLTGVGSRSAETNAPLKLILVGDGSERQSLEQQALELGIRDHVVFLGQRNDVARLLCGADIFVHAAVAEGCAYALSEAMAAGVPLVVTDAGAAREQVGDGVNGYVVPPDDVGMLRERMKVLIEDAALRQRMGRASRDRWNAGFRIEDQARAYTRVYGELAEQSMCSSRCPHRRGRKERGNGGERSTV